MQQKKVTFFEKGDTLKVVTNVIELQISSHLFEKYF